MNLPTSIYESQIKDKSIKLDQISDSLKDGNPNIPTLRSLGISENQAAAGNHTHDGQGGNGVTEEFAIAMALVLGGK